MKQEEVILHAKPHNYWYCVNVNAAVIDPLYDYYRKRIGCRQFTIDDNQRRNFEKIIVNMCWDNLIKIPEWIMRKPLYNLQSASHWWELKSDIIYDFKYTPILYADVRNEVRLLHRLLWFEKYGCTYDMDMEIETVFSRICDVDQKLGERLLRVIDRRGEA